MKEKEQIALGTWSVEIEGREVKFSLRKNSDNKYCISYTGPNRKMIGPILVRPKLDLFEFELFFKVNQNEYDCTFQLSKSI